MNKQQQLSVHFVDLFSTLKDAAPHVQEKVSYAMNTGINCIIAIVCT